MEDQNNGKTGKDDIQTKLDKKLGPEYISKRIGFGSSRVAYIEGWKAINLANQIFGYNGWSTEVKSVTVDFLDERQGKFNIGCTAIVRVRLADGTFREDIGYGTVENERRKASAFERAKKSAVTDALKRCLRGFGNALGNCLYDKDFLAKIDKVKFDPPDFDEGNLFRPTDELSEISRSNTISENHHDGPNAKKRNLGNDGGLSTNRIANRKNDYQHQLANNTSTNDQNMQMKAPLNPVNKEQQPTVEIQQPVHQDTDDLLDDSFMFSDEIQEEDLINMNNENRHLSSKGTHLEGQSNSTKKSANTEFTEELTFVTAKAASNLQNKTPIPTDAVFDPKFQAQSIRHTVDQSVSTPVRNTVLKERGIDHNRSSVYSKFAPKGKELVNKQPSNEQLAPARLEQQKTSLPSSPGTASATNEKEIRERAHAPVPSAVAPPAINPSVSLAQRPQVGRPRMLQQPNIKRNAL